MEAVPSRSGRSGGEAGEVSWLKSAHRVNIAEVAATAGVSVGTVSRVLNQSPNVREHTRRRVMEVIQRLNYRPSRSAESLSRGHTRTVVILVPFLTHPSAAARLAGAIGVLDDEGFDTVVHNVETPDQRDRHVAALTTRHEADGAVVMSLRLSDTQLAALRHAGVPLAMVDAEARGVPCTVVDDIRGGSLATEHLIALGHRRIGFIGDSRRRPWLPVDPAPPARLPADVVAAPDQLRPRDRPARPARRLGGRVDGAGTARPARPADRDLRGLGHSGHRRAGRGREVRPFGSR